MSSRVECQALDLFGIFDLLLRCTLHGQGQREASGPVLKEEIRSLENASVVVDDCEEDQYRVSLLRLCRWPLLTPRFVSCTSSIYAASDTVL